MLSATGRSVADHQALTVDNDCQLRQLAPSLLFIPVLQGWRLADYLDCVNRYAAAGVDMTAVSLVGLGSICRRQASVEIAAIVRELSGLGLRMHGFGVKTRGLAGYADGLVSVASTAWSYAARRRPPLPGCTSHRNCANCPATPWPWRSRLVSALDGPQQLLLGGVA